MASTGKSPGSAPKDTSTRHADALLKDKSPVNQANAISAVASIVNPQDTLKTKKSEDTPSRYVPKERKERNFYEGNILHTLVRPGFNPAIDLPNSPAKSSILKTAAQPGFNPALPGNLASIHTPSPSNRVDDSPRTKRTKMDDRRAEVIHPDVMNAPMVDTTSAFSRQFEEVQSILNKMTQEKKAEKARALEKQEWERKGAQTEIYELMGVPINKPSEDLKSDANTAAGGDDSARP